MDGQSVQGESKSHYGQHLKRLSFHGKTVLNTNNFMMRSDLSRLSAGLAGGLRLSDHAPLPPARHGHLSTQSLPHSEGR